MGRTAKKVKQADNLDDAEISTELITKLDSFKDKLQDVQNQIGQVVIGQDEIVKDLLVGIFSGGHTLIESTPGKGKTLLAETIGQVLGLQYNRIQCTPDLMPADILGAELLEENKETGRRDFRFEKGPVFAQILLVDEINRASPRTQSALLQAMQEGKITIGTKTYELPKPFIVIATQNPLEQEGVSPLPEAQLDRFRLKLIMDDPDRAAEKRIMLQTTSNEVIQLKPVFTADEILDLQKTIRDVPIGDAVAEAILDVVRFARPTTKEENFRKDPRLKDIFNFVQENVEYGPGTRAQQAFILTTKARALLEDRYVPSLDDVVALADPILRHRMGMTVMAQAENIDQTAVIQRLVEPFQIK